MCVTLPFQIDMVVRVLQLYRQELQDDTRTCDFHLTECDDLLVKYGSKALEFPCLSGASGTSRSPNSGDIIYYRALFKRIIKSNHTSSMIYFAVVH